jgi:hypothetical protein
MLKRGPVDGDAFACVVSARFVSLIRYLDVTVAVELRRYGIEKYSRGG